VVFVFHRDPDAIFGAQVAHENRDDQRIGLVAGHLHKAGRADVCFVLDPYVPEVLHLEQAG